MKRTNLRNTLTAALLIGGPILATSALAQSQGGYGMGSGMMGGYGTGWMGGYGGMWMPILVVAVVAGLVAWMQDLSARLRDVRILCGDWKRAVTPAVTTYHGTAAVLLDPPYDDNERTSDLYSTDSGTVSAEVRQWCLENGDNPSLLVALCGYAGEHDELDDAGWERFEWKANGGYGNQGKKTSRGRDNAAREVIWFNKSCVRPDAVQGSLF